MKKKKIDILSLIPRKPKGVTSGELILKLRLGTNKELREFNKEIQYLLHEKNIIRNTDGAFSLNSKSKLIKNIEKRNYKEYKASSETKPPYKKSYNPKPYIHAPIKSDPKEDFVRVCQEFKLPTIFTPTLQKEVHEHLKTINWGEEKKKRKIYPEEIIVTIDGEDAQDLDDAISVKKEGENFLLNIYIADVSYFVAENSLTDKEAQKRGNSVYLINRVIPMLPELLSNEYCSLNPEKEKLVLVCEMKISPSGEVLSSQFLEGFITTNYRLSYPQVERILQGDEQHNDTRLILMLKNAEKLAKILKKKRLKEGSLDFFLPDTRVICDKNDKPTQFEVEKPLFSQALIEDFMLIANQCAASLLWKNKTGVFRVHEPPSTEKLSEFYNIAKTIGIKVKPFRNSKDIQVFLGEERNPYLNSLLHQLLVRSMSQAQYSPKNIGHFGLGFSLYTHFTSPIRRYSDLLVHREIKGILKSNTKMSAFLPKYLSQVSTHISRTERTAIDAERKIQKLKAIRFLSEYPQDLVLPAHVTGIQARGVYVALDHTSIEGLIPSFLIPEYDYIEDSFYYKKRRSDEKILIGTPLMVKILNLNLEKVFIDFDLISTVN